MPIDRDQKELQRSLDRVAKELATLSRGIAGLTKETKTVSQKLTTAIALLRAREEEENASSL